MMAVAALLACSFGAGWQQHGTARQYEGENLFEYMDGNSEGYFLYGFVRLNGITCRRGDETILIDISEFSDAESAYGMFLSNRDVNQPIEDIGTGGQTAPRKAIFARDRYFVEIAAEKEADHTAELRNIAAGLASRIPGSTERPEELKWFPQGMVGGTARLIPASVLGISALKRGYVAQYGAGKAFVVAAANAEALMERLRGRFADARKVDVAEDAFTATDAYLGTICVFRKGGRVAGYANIAKAEDPVALAGALAARLP